MTDGPDVSAEPEPIVAVKMARLVAADARVQFVPCFPRALSHPYDAVTDAVCEGGRPHRAPDEHCRCGFHAVKARNELWRLDPAREAVVLDVELSGTVIEHEFGYRASRQAVLGVCLPATCTRWRCRRPTAGVAPYQSSAYEFELKPWTPLRPVCERCGKRHLWSLADLASELTVEVTVDRPRRSSAPAAEDGTRPGPPEDPARRVRTFTSPLAIATVMLFALVALLTVTLR
jgi:hypothetical protein